ncbi:RcnB family protein [Silvibacterium dinghuense]|uniref:Integral membrane protein n=1 Tax=Silvibacterium dinghuense TaxID=1560006 RepID=A0A4Q1SK88_9BACT|nr:RcnB family protein [Silvibacterium dinghuense]RXS97869.1 hypothetical protein ESZ00_08425 [Silvibacterium dinghuense]GGH02611.1 hypothetical protein GCM10011586_18050 [Silvibacterium dinghuense]
MKLIRRAAAVSTLAAMLAGGAMFAQQPGPGGPGGPGPGGPGGHDNHQYVRHNDWRKGRRMAQGDWARGERVDYQRYHLKPPPRGYEWREVDGNYVMAAVATGLIASVIVASTVH